MTHSNFWKIVDDGPEPVDDDDGVVAVAAVAAAGGRKDVYLDLGQSDFADHSRSGQSPVLGRRRAEVVVKKRTADVVVRKFDPVDVGKYPTSHQSVAARMTDRADSKTDGAGVGQLCIGTLRVQTSAHPIQRRKSLDAESSANGHVGGPDPDSGSSYPWLAVHIVLQADH